MKNKKLSAMIIIISILLCLPFVFAEDIPKLKLIFDESVSAKEYKRNELVKILFNYFNDFYMSPDDKEAEEATNKYLSIESLEFLNTFSRSQEMPKSTQYRIFKFYKNYMSSYPEIIIKSVNVKEKKARIDFKQGENTDSMFFIKEDGLWKIDLVTNKLELYKALHRDDKEYDPKLRKLYEEWLKKREMGLSLQP